MNCDCIKEINEKLHEKNLHLTGFAYVMPEFESIPTIETAWIDKDKAPRGKKNSPPKMFASHCPFCGKKMKK